MVYCPLICLVTSANVPVSNNEGVYISLSAICVTKILFICCDGTMGRGDGDSYLN